MCGEWHFPGVWASPVHECLRTLTLFDPSNYLSSWAIMPTGAAWDQGHCAAPPLTLMTALPGVYYLHFQQRIPSPQRMPEKPRAQTETQPEGLDSPPGRPPLLTRMPSKSLTFHRPGLDSQVPGTAYEPSSTGSHFSSPSPAHLSQLPGPQLLLRHTTAVPHSPFSPEHPPHSPAPPPSQLLTWLWSQLQDDTQGEPTRRLSGNPARPGCA